MGSVLAIVSKAVFQKATAKDVKVGDVFATDVYKSKNKGLQTLTDGGDLYLVTVRPDDVAWLVGVLRAPTFAGSEWKAKANVAPIVDMTKVIPKLTLENGKGIKPKPGRLGMSLQTPRALANDDVKLLEALTGKKSKAKLEKPAKLEKAAKTKATAKTKTKAKSKPSHKATAAKKKITKRVSAHLDATQQPAVLEGKVAAKVISTVVESAAAVRKDDLNGALALLLEAWGSHPAEPLGDRIERLGDAVVSEEARAAADAKKVDDETWDAMLKADRLGDRRALAHAMIATPQHTILKRAPLLCALPPDPRLSRTFTAWLGDLPFRALDSRPAWTCVFDYLRKHPDPESRNALLERAETDVAAGKTMQKWMRTQIAAALKDLEPAGEIGASAELLTALAALDAALDGAIGASSLERPAVASVKCDSPDLGDITLADVHEIGAARAAEIIASPGGQVLAVKLTPVAGYQHKRPNILSIIDAESGVFLYGLVGDRVFAISNDGKRLAYGHERDVVLIDLHTRTEIARIEIAGVPEEPRTHTRLKHLGAFRSLVFSDDDSQLIAVAIVSPVLRDRMLTRTVIRIDLESQKVSELIELLAPGDAPMEAHVVDGNLLTLLGTTTWVVDLDSAFVLQGFHTHHSRGSDSPFGVPGIYHPPESAGAELAIEVHADVRDLQPNPGARLLLVDPRTVHARLEFELPFRLRDVFVDENVVRVLVQDSPRQGQSKGPPLVATLDGDALTKPKKLPISVKDFECTAFDQRGRALVGDRFGEVHVWDVSSAKPAKTDVFRPSVSSVDGVGVCGDSAFAWNSAVLVFMGDDTPANLVERDAIEAAAAAPDGSLLFLGVTSGIYAHRIGEKRKKKITFEKGHAYDVTSLATSTTGRVASSSMDHAVILWDFAGKLVQRFAGHPDGAFDVAFHPAGEVLASVGADQKLRLWDETSADERAVYSLDELPEHVAWSADGTTIAWTSLEGVHLMAPDGSNQRFVALPKAGALVAHPTRPLFCVSTEEHVLLVGDDVRVISGDHLDTPESLAFSLDGLRLFIAAGTRERPGAVTELALEWG